MDMAIVRRATVRAIGPSSRESSGRDAERERKTIAGPGRGGDPRVAERRADATACRIAVLPTQS
jgi:hypothetical protein